MKKVHFYLKNATDKNSKIPTQVMVNFSYYGERLRKSASIKIAPCNWNFAAECPKQGFADYSEIKKKLSDFEASLLNGLKHFTDKGIIPSPAALIAFINNKPKLVREADILDFHEWFPEFLIEKGMETKAITMKKYDTLISLIKEFETKKKYPISFEAINDSFEIHFKHFLTSTKNQSNNTVSKYIECLKVYMRWALKKKKHNNRDFEDFKANRDKTKIIYLTFKELFALLNLDLTANPRLQRIREKFCFQCFVGQRFSDINKLKHFQIITNEQGEKYWVLYQDKGNKSKEVHVPIVGIALEILERQQKAYTKGYIFEKSSNQKYNNYIKELCCLAGIDEVITKRKFSGRNVTDKVLPKYKFLSSHTARRTFITLSHQLGMDSKSIQTIAGQEKHATLEKYLASDVEFASLQYKKAWGSLQSMAA